ncbi:MAG: YceI family protein [Fibrobacterota bacterium]
MKNTIFSLMLIIAVFSASFAESAQATITPSFDAEATMHSFSGRAPAVSAPVEITADSAGDTVVSLSAAVPVRSITTDNDKRDENMYGMFEADTWTAVRGVVQKADLARIRPGGAEDGLPFKLVIRDRGYYKLGTVTQWRESAEEISFRLSFPVSLKRYKLQPPSPMPKVLKVKDRVDVTCDVVITRQVQ